MPADVLLGEDETTLRMTMGDRLRNEGYVVDYAANGDEGFDKATALPFDLILLDVLLPYRNGLLSAMTFVRRASSPPS
jgi:two-component system OmpR family response regulator